MNRSFLLFSLPEVEERATLSLLWSRAFTIGARLPNNGRRLILLEVLVLEVRFCRDHKGALPDGVVFFRERQRLVWLP